MNIRYSKSLKVDGNMREVIHLYGDEYVTLDNRLAKNKKCFIYHLNDLVPSHMIYLDMHILTLLWKSDEKLYRMTLKANTMAGVMIIRCASESPTFSKNGEMETPARTHISYKVLNDTFIESPPIEMPETIYIRALSQKYHERSDLRFVVDSDYFEIVNYETCISELVPLSIADEIEANEQEIMNEKAYLRMFQ